MLLPTNPQGCKTLGVSSVATMLSETRSTMTMNDMIPNILATLPAPNASKPTEKVKPVTFTSDGDVLSPVWASGDLTDGVKDTQRALGRDLPADLAIYLAFLAREGVVVRAVPFAPGWSCDDVAEVTERVEKVLARTEAERLRTLQLSGASYAPADWLATEGERAALIAKGVHATQVRRWKGWLREVSTWKGDALRAAETHVATYADKLPTRVRTQIANTLSAMRAARY